LFTLGFAVAPLAVWALASLRRPDWRDPGRVAGWSLGLLALLFVVHRNGSFYVTLPNYLNRYGAYSSAGVGLPPPVFGLGAWAWVERIAVFGGVVLAGEVCQVLSHPRAAVRYLRQAGPMAIAVSVYGVVGSLGVIGLAFAGQLQFDRYLLPLVAPAGMLLVRRPVQVPRLRPVAITACALVFAALAAVSANLMFATGARDAGRWDAAARLARAGVPADQINAGLEWNGIHSSVPADPINKLGLGRPDHYGGQYWTKVFDRSSDCWIVSMSKDVGIAHASIVQTWTIHPYAMSPRTAHVYVFERPLCRGAFRPPVSPFVTAVRP